MRSCKEVTRLLSESHDRPLLLGERISLSLHLSICSMCRRYKHQLAFVQRAIGTIRIMCTRGDVPAVDVAMPQETKTRLKETVRSHLQDS